MAGVILESFAGVEDPTQLVGKYTSVQTNLEFIEDVAPCRGLRNIENQGAYRYIRYDYALSEVDNFAVVGFQAMVADLSTGHPTHGHRFIFLGEQLEPVDENDILITVLNTGAVAVCRSSTGHQNAATLVSTAASTITAGQPFTVGVEVFKSQTAGTVKIWVDGILLATGNTLDTWGDATTSTRPNYSRILIGAGDVGTGAVPRDWINSVFAFNSLGSDHRTYPGERFVGISFPVGNGPNTEFDPGTDNYANVDERNVIDGTDVVSADAAALEDLYTVRSAEASGALDVVQVTTRHRKTLASDVQYLIRGKLGGSTASSPALLPGTGWGNGRHVFQRAPNGGTWDIGDYDVSFFGQRATVVASGDLEIEQLYVEYLAETVDAQDCGVADEPGEIPEYDGPDLTIPNPSGLPIISAANVDEMTYAVEDPGGFADGFLRVPLDIEAVAPKAHLEDITVTYGELVLYQGRIEPITRDSDSDGMWVRYGTSGWQRHLIADQAYWGRLQDRRLDAWAGYAGVGPGDYVDQYSTSPVLAFSDGEPYITVNLPAGTGLNQPSGGVVQYDWRTDPYGPNPEIQRIRFNWSVNQIIPGCLFQIIAYSPVGSFAPPVTIYNQAHTAGTHQVTLFRDDVSVSAPDEAVIPAGTWRLLIRPYAFSNAVNTVPEPGLIVTIWQFSIGELATAFPFAASTVIDRILTDSCPAIDTTEIDATPAIIEGLVYETPTPPRDIVSEMLNFTAADPLADSADWTWGVKEKLPNGKYRFYFTPRRLTVRYEVTGVEIQGLTADVESVYNRVFVTYTDFLGRNQTVVVEQAVTLLDDLGLTRELHINAGTLKGQSFSTNTENAYLIANTALRESARPARVGQIRIVGSAQNPRVTDLDAGVLVPFFLVFPGELIRISDTQVTPATANPKDDPAVWRIRRGQYQIGGVGPHAILTVGQGSTRLEALMARLQAGQQP